MSSFVRLYVGVVDQTTNQMSIMPASLTTMLPLQPGTGSLGELNTAMNSVPQSRLKLNSPLC